MLTFLQWIYASRPKLGFGVKTLCGVGFGWRGSASFEARHRVGVIRFNPVIGWRRELASPESIGKCAKFVLPRKHYILHLILRYNHVKDRYPRLSTYGSELHCIRNCYGTRSSSKNLVLKALSASNNKTHVVHGINGRKYSRSCFFVLEYSSSALSFKWG